MAILSRNCRAGIFSRQDCSVECCDDAYKIVNQWVVNSQSRTSSRLLLDSLRKNFVAGFLCILPERNSHILLPGNYWHMVS